MLQTAVSSNIIRLVYRPAGKNHPEQWKAVYACGKQVDVTEGSAERIIRMARDFGLYGGLTRTAWQVKMPDDGGRRWWAYQLEPNELGRFLETPSPATGFKSWAWDELDPESLGDDGEPFVSCEWQAGDDWHAERQELADYDASVRAASVYGQ